LAEIWNYFVEEAPEPFAAEFLSRVGDPFKQALRFPLFVPQGLIWSDPVNPCT
jgi:hypothetical protein